MNVVGERAEIRGVVGRKRTITDDLEATNVSSAESRKPIFAKTHTSVRENLDAPHYFVVWIPTPPRQAGSRKTILPLNFFELH
jgi:hypothetical protein